MTHVVVEQGTSFEMSTAKRCLDALTQHYPGFQWDARVDETQKVITIHNYTLSGKWGFLLHLHRVIDNLENAVKMAGGELLERYRVRRGTANLDKIDELPVDFAGNLIADKD